MYKQNVPDDKRWHGGSLIRMIYRLAFSLYAVSKLAKTGLFFFFFFQVLIDFPSISSYTLSALIRLFNYFMVSASDYEMGQRNPVPHDYYLKYILNCTPDTEIVLSVVPMTGRSQQGVVLEITTQYDRELLNSLISIDIGLRLNMGDSLSWSLTWVQKAWYLTRAATRANSAG